jgi:hypothetical protein
LRGKRDLTAGLDCILTCLVCIYRAFLKGGEVLARPGVISAGHQAAFRESKPEVPSAFGADTETDAQKRAHFRYMKFLCILATADDVLMLVDVFTLSLCHAEGIAVERARREESTRS